MAVEILGGNGLHSAFKALGIHANQTYCGNDKPYYEVWELHKNDLKTLENISWWKDEWGWWRYAKGSNMGTPFSFFVVNGKELIAWDGLHRDDLRHNWNNEPDEERAAYHYSFDEYEKDRCPRVYENLTTYMCEEIGASTEKNVCALAVDLARANGMTMAQLFTMYEE